MDDFENRNDNTSSTNPFDKAAFDNAAHDDDDVEDLPAPSSMLEGEDELDTEAELNHQRKLDRIIAATKISADDQLRDEKIRQRKIRIDAENKLKAAAGKDYVDYPPPDPAAPDYSTPTASTRPIVVAASRFSVKKLKAAATAKAAEEEAEIERQLAEARARVRAKKKADRASLNVDFKK
jgi:hypothetical protein